MQEVDQAIFSDASAAWVRPATVMVATLVSRRASSI